MSLYRGPFLAESPSGAFNARSFEGGGTVKGGGGCYSGSFPCLRFLIPAILVGSCWSLLQALL
jgi:hypothetical protein